MCPERMGKGNKITADEKTHANSSQKLLISIYLNSELADEQHRVEMCSWLWEQPCCKPAVAMMAPSAQTAI